MFICFLDVIRNFVYFMMSLKRLLHAYLLRWGRRWWYRRAIYYNTSFLQKKSAKNVQNKKRGGLFLIIKNYLREDFESFILILSQFDFILNWIDDIKDSYNRYLDSIDLVKKLPINLIYLSEKYLHKVNFKKVFNFELIEMKLSLKYFFISGNKAHLDSPKLV